MRTLPVRSPDRSPPARLDFLDGLRGMAVGLVLVQHIGELTVPAVRTFTASTVQLGQLGVMLFFLCSGFIIPASLERGQPRAGRRSALGAFWWGRVFRLYPLYWLSLAAAALLVVLGRYAPEEPLSAGDWMANAALLQLPAGAPNALDLYWTLALEMVFYVAVSVAFLLGVHRRSVGLSLLASVACLAAAALVPQAAGRPAPLALFCLATMFLGTVFQRWHAGSVGGRALAGCVGAALAAGTALLASAADDLVAAGGPGPVPMLAAWVGAYAVFTAGLALRRRSVPGWLRRLGTISYSVYLVHALVLVVVPPLSSPLLAAAVWGVLAVAASELTYRLVEQPGVRLGRRLRAARSPGADRLQLVPLTVTGAGAAARTAVPPQRIAV